MNEPKRRLCLPSLNPARRALMGTDTNGDDATRCSATRQPLAEAAASASESASASASAAEELTSSSMASKSDRVLRYGETVETLFCLDLCGEGHDDGEGEGHDDDDDGQKKLCQAVCGEKCDDARAWGEVLQGVLRAIGGRQDAGKRLIHLHRRATSRFKLSSYSQPSPCNDHVLKIWLFYAIVLLTHDSSNAAKDTYRHIQRLVYANHSNKFIDALFSQTFNTGAIQLDQGVLLLKQSVQEGVKPMDIVDKQIRGLELSGLLHPNTLSIAPSSRQIALPSLPGKASAERGSNADGVASTHSVLSTRQPPERRNGGGVAKRVTMKSIDKSSSAAFANEGSASTQSILSKRPTTDQANVESDGCIKRVQINAPQTSKRTLDRLNQSTDNNSYRAKLESRKKLRTERLATRARNKGVSISAILSQTPNDEEQSDEECDSSKKNQSFTDAPATNTSTTPEQADETWPKEGTALPSAPDSDQARKHFKENISPIDEEGTASIKDMDLGYLLNWDPSKREKKVTIAEHKGKDNSLRSEGKKAPKITRNDLGYMMNWEPFPKRDELSTADAAPKQNAKRAHGNMSRIEEEGTEASLTSGGDNGATAHSGATCSSGESDVGNDAKEPKRTSMDTHASSKSNGASRETEKSTASSELSNVEHSFLPLIEKNNVIKVDNEPYAKLGVIGKGGSCKVYRALSRECDVVALKKVKLDGLNKAAIDGYANEIALLKRLKGNPAIIQLYSSEVDLERKSIYLVMELGEVDLNYVLRQQELMSSKQGRGGRSTLNMNFIRLTWQQMLTAVHSIHEERIVHSDLKPANFLFVRGALKLIDFGIAKAIESQDTTNVYRETLSGTLSYMSPEAIMDTSTNSNGVRVNKCGRASDIWSLGCILYQMVYGKTPFADCQGIAQKVMAITNPNHAIHFPDDVDEAAIDAMKLCLERNPKRRGTITGKNGLLNEHIFLHSRTRR